MPVPSMTSLPEHMLDLANVDFATNYSTDQNQLDKLVDGWKTSRNHRELVQMIDDEASAGGMKSLLSMKSTGKPSSLAQIGTLLHRAFIKSYRDFVAYWIRVAMYIGLAIMIGTVWLRLDLHQDHIQSFISAIFYGSAFMSFMGIAYVPAFLEDRAIFVKERANGLYGPTVFLITNFLISMPYLFLMVMCFSLVSYWLTGFQSTPEAFFMWIAWLFIDLLAAESLVVFMASVYPNFIVSLVLISFANGLWMAVGGFLVSVPVLNVFYKYTFHYIDFQGYVFQGMVVNEFQNRIYDCARIGDTCQCIYPTNLQSECKIPGTAVLSYYNYATGRQGLWFGITLGITFAYRLFAWFFTWLRKS